MLRPRRRWFLCALGLGVSGRAIARPAPRWRSLFDGRSLAGWDTWLGIPHPSVSGVVAGAPVGLNHDPKGVFRVVRLDGAPAIRISGEIFGALTSREEFGDYHLRLEYRWGEAKWPPKQQAKRDSGVLYHCTGEHGVSDPGRSWMRSLECQVQEGDTGDFWSVAGVFADVTGRRDGRLITYAPDGDTFTVPSRELERRVIRRADFENPAPRWNRVDVVALGDQSWHAVNGQVVMRLGKVRAPGPAGALAPLVRGRLQIQSEGAEVYYRALAIRPITAFPADLRA